MTTTPSAGKTKGGALARLAGLWCQDERFRRFLVSKYYAAGTSLSAEQAADLLRKLCGVGSRAEIDTNQTARKAFLQIRSWYMAWSGENS